MRWVGILPFLLAGCSSPTPAGGGDSLKVEFRQGVRDLEVEPGAIGEHVAWCPNDMWAVSGGYAIPVNPQSFAVTSNMPFGGKWRVTARNTTDTKGCIKS